MDNSPGPDDLVDTNESMVNFENSAVPPDERYFEDYNAGQAATISGQSR